MAKRMSDWDREGLEILDREVEQLTKDNPRVDVGLKARWLQEIDRKAKRIEDKYLTAVDGW